MRLLIIYGLLFVSSNLFSQDSLKLIPVTAWKLSRLIQETISGRSCDSLQSHQAKELQKMGLELAATKEGLNMAVNALSASQSESNHLRQALTASESITKETGRKERKRGRREGATIVAVIAVVLLLL